MRACRSCLATHSLGFAAMRYEIAIGLLSLLPLLAACSRPAPAATELPVPKVTVSAVVSQETIDADEYTGQTEASEIVEIRARVFGYLKSIDFKDGDYVQEGQTLFTIEPDEYDAIHQQSVSRIELNQASLALAKAKHARNEKLVRTGAVTPEEFEESQTAVVEAEAKITAAKADANRTAIDLKYTVLKAPISGRIDRALVSKGNLLTGGTGSGTLLTKIVKEQPMYVYFDVDERSLLRYMRQRGESRDTAPGSLREEGKLDFAATEVSTSTGTARIRAVFPNEDRALASGLFVRVKIPVSKPYEALLVPERALAADQNIKFVYVVGSDGTATRRNVELGGQRGEMRIVTKGLQAGDRVIVKGLQRVKPGQKVEAELAQVDATPTTLRKPVTPAAPTRTRPAAVPQPTQQRSASHER
jgi:multidrug efflux system membrane fusion protein